MSYAKQTMDAPHQVNDASRGSQSHMMYCITAAYGQLGGREEASSSLTGTAQPPP